MSLRTRYQNLWKSNKRLEEGFELYYGKARTSVHLAFLRKEAWINLKRSLSLWRGLRRAKPGDE